MFFEQSRSKKLRKKNVFSDASQARSLLEPACGTFAACGPATKRAFWDQGETAIFSQILAEAQGETAVLGQILARSLLEPDPEQKPVGSNFLPFGGHSAGYCISLLGRTGNGYIYNFRTNSKQTEAMNQHCEAKNT